MNIVKNYLVGMVVVVMGALSLSAASEEELAAASALKRNVECANFLLRDGGYGAGDTYSFLSNFGVPDSELLCAEPLAKLIYDGVKMPGHMSEESAFQCVVKDLPDWSVWSASLKVFVEVCSCLVCLSGCSPEVISLSGPRSGVRLALVRSLIEFGVGHDPLRVRFFTTQAALDRMASLLGRDDEGRELMAGSGFQLIAQFMRLLALSPQERFRGGCW